MQRGLLGFALLAPCPYIARNVAVDGISVGAQRTADPRHIRRASSARDRARQTRTRAIPPSGPPLARRTLFPRLYQRQKWAPLPFVPWPLRYPPTSLSERARMYLPAEGGGSTRGAAATSAVSALTRWIYVYKVVRARRAFRKPRTTPLDIPGSERKRRTLAHEGHCRRRCFRIRPAGEKKRFSPHVHVPFIFFALATSARWVDSHDIRYFRYSRIIGHPA